MEKQVTLIFRYDLVGFTNALNDFFKRLSHYRFFNIQYDISDKGYTALILHQKLN